VTAVRALLDRWRTATRGNEEVWDVLARGDRPFLPGASEPLIAATLQRCTEMLADAMQADACDAYEAERQAQGLTASPPLVIASDVDPVGAVRS
jgi:hypothetical protein